MYSNIFIIIIVLFFIIALLNLIFSLKTDILNAFEFKVFEEYPEILNLTFIMDLEFGENLYKNDIFCHYKRDPINKWRNTSIRIRNKTFEIKIFNDIISHEEICSLGYKKCGLVNSNDSLCLKLDEACPINKVLINNNEEYGNYKSFKLGDKYIHYSNE